MGYDIGSLTSQSYPTRLIFAPCRIFQLCRVTLLDGTPPCRNSTTPAIASTENVRVCRKNAYRKLAMYTPPTTTISATNPNDVHVNRRRTARRRFMRESRTPMIQKC